MFLKIQNYVDVFSHKINQHSVKTYLIFPISILIITITLSTCSGLQQGSGTTRPAKLESSIFIIDTDTETITEKGGLSNAYWGYRSTAVVGNKVIMGRGSGREGAGTSILIVDTEKETVTEKDGLSKAFWGSYSTVVAGNKVVMRGHNSILIVDTNTMTVTEKGGLSEAHWGLSSTAVVGNKLVAGTGFSYSNSILIVDTDTGTVTEKGGLSKAYWGRDSTAVAGNKVVMGRGSAPFGSAYYERKDAGTSILIIDTEKETVTEKDGLSKALWGYDKIASSGNKVVMGRDNNAYSILIIDTEKETVTEKTGLPPGIWDNNTIIIGNKIISGLFSNSLFFINIDTGTVTKKATSFFGHISTPLIGNKLVIVHKDSISTIDTLKETVTEITKRKQHSYVVSYTDAIIVGGDKVVIGCREDHNSYSILIVDTNTMTVTEKSGLSRTYWEWKESAATIGNKVIIGRKDYGNSILIIDAAAKTVTEKTVPSYAKWGHNSTVAVKNKVLMGRGDAGKSILIIDANTGTVVEKDGFSEAQWGYDKIAVTGNKVVMGGGDNSILIVDANTGTVTEKTGLPNALWNKDSMVVVGNKIIVGRPRKD